MEQARLAAAARAEKLADNGYVRPSDQPAQLGASGGDGHDDGLSEEDDDDELLDNVVDALNDLRQWREGTAAKARALGVALAAAPGLSAAVARQISQSHSSGRSGGATSTGGGLPDALQHSFDSVLSETGRLLQLAEHQVVGTIERAAFSAQQLAEEGHSSTLHRYHASGVYLRSQL